jgi:hypothetical protein
MRFLTILVAIILLIVIPTIAQTNSLNWEDEAQKSDLMSEDAWEIRINDGGSDYLSYRYTRISDNNLDVDVADQLNDERNCEGYTTLNAFYSVEWSRRDIRENERLRLFVVSRADTVLVIRQPDGTWICNDNYDDVQHPLIDIERPRTGNYSVWIANKEHSQFDADLYVTLQDYNPYPNEYEFDENAINIISSNPGAGSNAKIVFIGITDTENSCEVSVDLRVNGSNWDEITHIRIVVYPIISGQRVHATNTRYSLGNYTAVTSAIRQQEANSVINYDYGHGADHAEPFELRIPHSIFANDVSSYQLEVILQRQQDNQWIDMNTYTTPNDQYCDQ